MKNTLAPWKTRKPIAWPAATAAICRRASSIAPCIWPSALWLAERDGLRAALLHWLQGARLALMVLMVLAIVSGAGLAFAALGNGQTPVNVFWALGSLLGLNLILLLSWALGLLFAGEHSASLGRLWLWLSEKLARDAKAAQLAPALLLLLQRQKLNRWAVGVLVNGLWLLALCSALVILLTLMATRRYGFVWETTILGADTFVSVTQALGSLPALLGFSVPSVEMIRTSPIQLAVPTSDCTVAEPERRAICAISAFASSDPATTW